MLKLARNKTATTVIASESLKMAMARVLQTGDVREYESGLVERLSSLMREVGGPPLVV